MTLRERLTHAGCTPTETEATILHYEGWGYRRIARHENVSVTTIRDRIANAHRKLAYPMPDPPPPPPHGGPPPGIEDRGI